MRRIFRAIEVGFMEPRIALALDLNNHNFHAAMRSELKFGLGEHGELTVPPMGKRREVKQVALTPRERLVLHAARNTGVLQDCERAHQAGMISDYPLFPAGLLVDGRVASVEGTAPLKQPAVEPRIRLAIELSAECRLGQVFLCRRSNLALAEVSPAEAELCASGTLGSLVVPGKPPKKQGEMILLTPEQYRTVRYELEEGYLSALEALYQAGAIRDYLLFPAGKLLKGKAPMRANATAMHRAAGLQFFRELEELAGVRSVAKRGWNGLRRKATDVARRYTTDAKVLNAQGGWKDSRTREDIYQDPENVEVQVVACVVRRASRLGLPAPEAESE